MELMYMNLPIFCILPQNIVQSKDGSKRIHNWTERLSWTLLLTLSWMWIMHSGIIVHDMKDLGDILEPWIHSPHSYSHLLESWNKLLEIIEDSLKRLEGTLSKG